VRNTIRVAQEAILVAAVSSNGPAIVLSDVDAKAIAPELFWAAFQNDAQFCNVTKRLYIYEAVYDEVRDALVEFIDANIKVGDGTEADTDLGSIQNSMQYGKVKDYFADCHANG
jgi:acyl-CoA reductase-like NAD-dependent aldehyde dehydrogenase